MELRLTFVINAVFSSLFLSHVVHVLAQNRRRLRNHAVGYGFLFKLVDDLVVLRGDLAHQAENIVEMFVQVFL